MKKLRSIMAAALAAAMLTGCAGKKTESAPEFSDSPFSSIVSDTTSEPQSDNYDELFGKYQTGRIQFGNYSIKGDEAFEYNGGEIELSFDMNTSGNQYDAEAGFMAFINGVPQKLSLNGGESNEFVRISLQPDKSEKATLSFTPTIPEELKNEKTLQLKYISIFNPSYKPAGSFTGFGNAHQGQPFCEFDITVNSPLDVSESALEPIDGECESVLITDGVAKKYGIKKPDENSVTTVSIRDAQTKDEPLSLRGGKLDAELLIYGSETYNYSVYVYVNHERVRFNGGDYLELAAKSGYLNVLKLELEDTKERDIIYAVAVPTNAKTGSMAVRKGGSVLVLNEDGIVTESVPVTPIDPPDDPSDTSDKSDTTPDNMNTNIYAYHPEEYIDSEQRYLLLSRHLYESHDETLYDYIVYDEKEQKVIGTMTLPEFGSYQRFTYDDGVFVLDVTDWAAVESGENSPRFVVYNEKLEPIKTYYSNDVPDCYSVRYYLSQKSWYYHKTDEGNSVFKANEDFSGEVKIFDEYIPKFYIVGDKIVYYKSIHDTNAPQNEAAIFGISDLDGNIISETKVASDGCGSFRLKKAGERIVFMSPMMITIQGSSDLNLMDGILIYDCKTGEQKMFTPENQNELCFCDVSPDGRHIVTGVELWNEDISERTGLTLNVYDTETLELLDSKTYDGSNNGIGLDVFNDRVMRGGAGGKTIMFNKE